MIRLEGEHLPDETRGQVVPVLIGAFHEDVPGIPLQVGYTAVLATNCGIETPDPDADPPVPAGLPVIEISGPNLDKIITKVPGHCVIQIDQEWLRYSAFLSNPYRLVIAERGLGQTEPAKHAKGAQVYFVESHPVYLFAWNPPGHQYPPNAVVKVRVNDDSQVPFHTIRVQDTRWVLGERFISVEFDLTRALTAVGGAGSSSVVAIAGGAPTADEERARARDPILRAIRRKRQRLARQGKLPRRRGWYPPIAGGAGVLGFTGLSPNAGAAMVYRTGRTNPAPGFLNRNRLLGIGILGPPAPAPPPPTAPVPTRPAAIGSSKGDPTPAPVRLLLPPLGRVTADIIGLQDDTAGSMGQGPSAVMIHPAPIAKFILGDTYGERRLRESVWAATHARQAALGLTWRFRWTGEPFETFRSLAGFSGQADLFLDDAGYWQYKFRERQEAEVATLTEREIVGEVGLGFTGLDTLATRLNVTWGNTTLHGGTFILDSPMQARFGVRARDLPLAWLDSENGARQVARYWLSQWQAPRQVARVAVVPALAALTRTDRVKLDIPLVKQYTGASIQFQIRATTDRGGERVLTLIEADPFAFQVLAYGTLSGLKDIGIPAHGTLDSTGDILNRWQALLPGDVIRW